LEYGDDKSDPMEIKEDGGEVVNHEINEEYDNDGDDLVKKSPEKEELEYGDDKSDPIKIKEEGVEEVEDNVNEVTTMTEMIS
jgi:flagellar basal body rod protein FlgG